jgi:hypothetical protein
MGNNTMETSRKIEVSIHRSEIRQNESGQRYGERLEGAGKKLIFGSLLDAVIEDPYYLADVSQEGTITLTVERTHEWELVLAWLIAHKGAVVTAFVSGASRKLGERFAEWALDMANTFGGKKPPELRADNMTVRIESKDRKKTKEEVAKVFESASKIELVVLP